MRTGTLLLLASTLTAATICAATITVVQVAAGGPESSGRPPTVAPPPPVPSTMRVAAVLRVWDARRSDAWAHADPRRLARLYTAGSQTGARDLAELRRWRARGVRVVGLRQQVAAVRVLHESTRRLVLRVTDRTVDGVAVGHHRRTAIPRSAWATHRISLQRAKGCWLVEEVVAQPAR
jgi:hypothetical protein